MRNTPVTSTPKRDNIWSLYRTASDRYNDLAEPVITLDPTGSSLDHVCKNNNNFNDTDVGTLNYLLKYQQAQRDNNILLISLRDREREIEKLKLVIKSLQSESESTDSRHDKSSSMSSGLPVVRVTPQKRIKNINTALSPRRNSRRSLFESSDSQIVATDPLSYSRQILRNAGIESDILLSSSSNSTSRHFSQLQDLSSLSPIRTGHVATRTSIQPENRHRPVSPVNVNRTFTNTTFVVDTSSRIPGNPPPTARDEADRPPSYYLHVNRPSFIRRSELRQSIIKEASRRREQIERKRKDAVRALAMGVVSLDEVCDKIFVDSTKIQAFPKTDMMAITQRRITNTREYKDRIMEREKKIEQASNRILKTCFSWKTRNRMLI